MPVSFVLFQCCTVLHCSVLILCDPTNCVACQARILEWVAMPNPGIEPRSSTLQADSLPSEPPGKPKNTGVGSLSLLHGILPTQGLNWGLLHCRRIIYQLSYQGSPPCIFYVEYISFYNKKYCQNSPISPFFECPLYSKHLDEEPGGYGTISVPPLLVMNIARVM